MWLPRVVTAAPASEPVTLSEVKAHCRVDDSNSDTFLTGLISAARQHVEQYTGLAIVSQTVEVRCSAWCDLDGLPVAPVSAITSVKYLDTTATEQTLSGASYSLVGANTLQPSIAPGYGVTLPSVYAQADAIRVVVTAGYSTVPAPVKHAILLLIGHWNEHREAVAEGQFGEVPMAVTALLSNYRVFA